MATQAGVDKLVEPTSLPLSYLSIADRIYCTIDADYSQSPLDSRNQKTPRFRRYTILATGRSLVLSN